MSGADEQSPGRVVAGRYRLESLLGRGGMGVVWLAVDTLIERRVALKELRTPTGVSEGETASFVERALREARSAGRLNHPGVVGVHDVIAPAGDDSVVYIVMEYVQAPTLAAIIDEQGPLPAPRVAAMGLGILDALDAAHAMGIVHRDIKPRNVLIAAGDRVKLTDFGIALAAEDTRLTRSGVLGTHAYLAPECFDTGQAGPAADLWALGATLFHAVAGRAPFERDTTTATLRAILFEEPPAPPCEPPLAEAITGLLTRPVDRRLTSNNARQVLQPAATGPASSPPTADTHPTPGQAVWEAQATALHPRSPTTSPPPLASATRPPGGPLPPYPTGPGTRPAVPTQSYTGAASGTGLPRQTGPTTSPIPRAPWGGPPQQRRSTTPWLVGGVAAAAALLLLVVVLAVSGGSDSGDDGEDAQALAQDLLDAVNSGDGNTAVGTLCPSSYATPDVMEAATGTANLEIDPARVHVDPDIGDFGASLVGTVNGAPIDGYISSVSDSDSNSDTGFCIYRFDLDAGSDQ